MPADGTFQILRGETVLADGDGRTGAIVSDGPAVNGTHLLDIATFLFADRPVIFDRTADSDTVTFTISRSHETMADSLDHALRHGRFTRGVADLVIAYTEGDTTIVWRSKAAGWQANQIPAPVGLATSVQYTVICPGWENPEHHDSGNPDLTGDLDGGDDTAGDFVTDDWDGLAGDDDDGAVVATMDGGQD